MIKKLLFISLNLFISLQFAQAQNPLILGTYNKKASKDKTVCTQVYGRNFNNILSMQYSIKWNEVHLKFKSIQNFGLKDLNERNFGLKQVNEGVMTTAWYDQQLRGVSLADGAALYEVCFDVIGDTGTTTFIEFVNEPTIIEVSVAPGNIVKMQSEGGKLDIR